MKTMTIFLSIMLSSSLLYSQSSIVYDAGTTIDVGTGADVCAAVITINGTYSGGGTFCNVPVAVENEDDLGTPKEFSLSQNYPNPFNPSTKIKYTIPSVGISLMKFIQLKVFDVLGNEVATLVNEERPAGSYEVALNAEGLTSGVYFFKLQVGSFVETKKMILLR